MKYYVRIGSSTQEVDVEGGRVVVGGQTLETHFAAVPGTLLYHLILAGESWTVAAQPLDGLGRWALGIVGERVEVSAVDERTQQIQALTERGRPAAAEGTVRAPMPGLVVRIEVEEGQRVDAGAGLVVVEAMKMENELRASRAAVVQTIHVSVGQPVEKGARLVTLASRADPPSPSPSADPPSATS